jgi:hypothetical protein
MDWAKHGRRKAAAKCHMRLDLQSFLPVFVLVDSAKQSDPKHARAVCLGGRAQKSKRVARSWRVSREDGSSPWAPSRMPFSVPHREESPFNGEEVSLRLKAVSISRCF